MTPKEESKNLGGRPAKYKTPEEMQIAIDDYFNNCFANDKNPTMTGLAYELGFTSRKALLDYREKDGFLNTIKKARLRVEIANEELLISGKPATGVIFNLKNNFGWQDKQEEEQQQSNTVVNIVLDKPDDTDQP